MFVQCFCLYMGGVGRVKGDAFVLLRTIYACAISKASVVASHVQQQC